MLSSAAAGPSLLHLALVCVVGFADLTKLWCRFFRFCEGRSMTSVFLASCSLSDQFVQLP